MAAAIVLIPTLAVTGSLHLAGGRADSNARVPRTYSEADRSAAAAPSWRANPPVDPQVLYWKAKAVKRLRLASYFEEKRNDLRRVLLRSRSVTEAINLACATYGYCSTLWRKAKCETGGTFDPSSHNPSGASGLFQFLLSTWRTTPYRGFSIFNPYANALAAGWMHEQGRGGEWVCR